MGIIAILLSIIWFAYFAINWFSCQYELEYMKNEEVIRLVNAKYGFCPSELLVDEKLIQCRDPYFHYVFDCRDNCTFYYVFDNRTKRLDELNRLKQEDEEFVWLNKMRDTIKTNIKEYDD